MHNNMGNQNATPLQEDDEIAKEEVLVPQNKDGEHQVIPSVETNDLASQEPDTRGQEKDEVQKSQESQANASEAKEEKSGDSRDESEASMFSHTNAVIDSTVRTNLDEDDQQIIHKESTSAAETDPSSDVTENQVELDNLTQSLEDSSKASNQGDGDKQVSMTNGIEVHDNTTVCILNENQQVHEAAAGVTDYQGVQELTLEDSNNTTSKFDQPELCDTTANYPMDEKPVEENGASLDEELHPHEEKILDEPLCEQNYQITSNDDVAEYSISSHGNSIDSVTSFEVAEKMTFSDENVKVLNCESEVKETKDDWPKTLTYNSLETALNIDDAAISQPSFQFENVKVSNWESELKETKEDWPRTLLYNSTKTTPSTEEAAISQPSFQFENAKVLDSESKVKETKDDWPKTLPCNSSETTLNIAEATISQPSFELESSKDEISEKENKCQVGSEQIRFESGNFEDMELQKIEENSDEIDIFEAKMQENKPNEQIWKAQKATNVKNNCGSHEKSPSFNFDFMINGVKREESDKTPLLYQSKPPLRSLSTPSNGEFSIIPFVGKEKEQCYDGSVEEKIITIERPDPANSRGLLTSSTKDEGESRQLLKYEQETSKEKNKPRSPSFFSSCICCSGFENLNSEF